MLLQESWIGIDEKVEPLPFPTDPRNFLVGVADGCKVQIPSGHSAIGERLRLAGHCVDFATGCPNLVDNP